MKLKKKSKQIIHFALQLTENTENTHTNMEEEDFLTDEEVKNLPEQGSLRIELWEWHVIVSLFVCYWMVNNLIASFVTKCCQKNGRLAASRSYACGERSPLSLRLLQVMILTDFVITASLLLGGLFFFLLLNFIDDRQESFASLNCENVNFILLYFVLFVINCAVIRQALLIGFASKYIPGPVAFVWISSITITLFSYRFVFPHLSLPEMQICLPQTQPNVDAFASLVLTIVAFVNIFSADTIRRISFKHSIQTASCNFLELGSAMEKSDDADRSGEYGKSVFEEKGHNVKETGNLSDDQCKSNDMAPNVFDTKQYETISIVGVALSGCLPVCFIFLSKYFQETSVEVKLILSGFVQMCMSVWNICTLKISVWTSNLQLT